MSVLKYKDPNTGEYKPVIGGGGGGNVSTPDWLQNDETASDYIKNRPFYDTVEVIFPVTELTGSGSAELPSLGLISGESYIVTFNGTKYPVTAKNFDLGNGIVAVAMGNEAFAGGTDTGEPFAIAEVSGYGISIQWNTGDTTVTLEITGKGIKKLDEKYLPQINGVVYVPVTDTGSANNPEYSTTVTVGELKRAIDSGKFVVVKVTSTTASPPLISYYPLISHYEMEAPLIVYFGNPNEMIRFYLPDDLEFDTFEELYDVVYSVIQQ